MKKLLATTALLISSASSFAQQHQMTESSQEMVFCEGVDYPWYNQPCAINLSIGVDFLYWYGKEKNLAYAAKQVTYPSSTLGGNELYLFPVSMKELHASWDPGVRVSLFGNLPSDGWDIGLAWTYYKNTAKDTSSVPAFDFETSGLGAASLSIPSMALGRGPLGLSNYFSQISGKWRFKFNRLDFEIGKRYYTSEMFTLRPFAGVVAYWSSFRFNADAQERTFLLDTSNFTTNRELFEKNSHWGAGLKVGFEPTWNFSQCFALFGEGDIALAWGNEKLTHKETISVLQVSSSSSEQEGYNRTTNYQAYGMTPIIDLVFGVRFERYWCDCRFHASLDAGWENHFFFSHNARFSDSGVNGVAVAGDNETAFYSTEQVLNRNDVSFGGFILRGQIDF